MGLFPIPCAGVAEAQPATSDKEPFIAIDIKALLRGPASLDRRCLRNRQVLACPGAAGHGTVRRQSRIRWRDGLSATPMVAEVVMKGSHGATARPFKSSLNLARGPWIRRWKTMARWDSTLSTRSLKSSAVYPSETMRSIDSHKTSVPERLSFNVAKYGLEPLAGPSKEANRYRAGRRSFSQVPAQAALRSVAIRN